MKTIETTATVTRRRRLHLQLQLPDDFLPGTHRVVVVIDNQPLADDDVRPTLAFPVDDYGPWPQTLSLSREELYDDFGR
jgi:hypothetical protein